MQALLARTILMPAHSCTLHARLWSAEKHGWIDFPLEKMEAIRNLHRFFTRRDSEASAYRTTETACDQCEARDVQQCQETLQEIDPRGEEGILF